MKDYSFYIGAAYGFAVVVVGFLVVRITLDYHALKRKLARFEAGEKGQ
jgi:heme exporter protein CcmD